MKRSALVSIFLLVVLILPAQAQWPRRAVYGFKKMPQVRVTLATQRALNQALRQQFSPSSPYLLTKSTFTLKMSNKGSTLAQHWENFPASAFVFEEKYNGKTYLWGVTASHYFLEQPILAIPQTGEESPVQFIAQGHYRMNDVTLFLIPPALQHKLKPFKLAARSPKKGDKLFSAGYFDDDFHVETNRVVKDILPSCFLTSLTVQDKLAREGACGGPVLNQRGELVGMHAGSSSRRQVGFVVPVEHIYEILQAYHNDGQAPRPLYFNGHEIGTININESIESIEVWKGNKLQETFLSYRKRAEIDYNHLEKLVDVTQADKIVFTLERLPFSALDTDQKIHRFEITYNLRNFHISKRQIQ